VTKKHRKHRSKFAQFFDIFSRQFCHFVPLSVKTTHSYTLFHDLLLRSYLQHCLWSGLTGHNSLRQIGLAVAATAIAELAQLIRPMVASWKLRYTRCQWACATVFGTKNALKLFIHLRISSKSARTRIRDVKSSKVARKPNRNTKQISLNPSNIAHTRRIGNLLGVSWVCTVLWSSQSADQRTHVPH